MENYIVKICVKYHDNQFSYLSICLKNCATTLLSVMSPNCFHQRHVDCMEKIYTLYTIKKERGKKELPVYQELSIAFNSGNRSISSLSNSINGLCAMFIGTVMDTGISQ